MITNQNHSHLDTLYVSWQQPTTRQWFVIGILEQSFEGFRFAYTLGAADAYKVGFRPLIAFPDMNKEYRQPTLFATFHNRLLPTSRPDYADFLSWLSVSSTTANSHPLLVLERTSGTRQTDVVELFRRPSIEKNGTIETCFFIRGLRYRSSEVQTTVEHLSHGTALWLALDLQNPQDPNAVLLRTTDDIIVPGYLPRHLVAIVREILILTPNNVQVIIEKINPSPAPVQLRMLCKLTAFDVPTTLSALHETMYKELIHA